MPVAEISVVPIGTLNPSISEFVVEAIKVAKNSGLKYEITAMGTNIEGSLDDIFAVAQAMHQKCLLSGALRVSTIIRIDERVDKLLTLESKKEAVKKGLAKKL
jgi:uncharacterized protein (TIGR00106 family)